MSLKKVHEKKELWFFVGSQDLYGEDTLKKVAKQSEKIVTELNKKNPIPIVLKPTLKSSDAILEAFYDAGKSEKCVGIILWCHTFSPAKMWIRGLNVNTKPLLQINTQVNVEIPWKTIDMDFMNLNQAAHGDREFGYILSRKNINRKIVIGHYSNPKVVSQIANWSRACVGWYESNNLKVLRIGDNMRNVAVTEGDKTEAENIFGCSVNTWGVYDLVNEIKTVNDNQISDTLNDYYKKYNVSPELKKNGAKEQSLVEAIKIEIGLRKLLQKNDAHAFTDTFEDLGDLVQLPGVAVQRLMADGYGFGAEGDWKTSVLVRIAKAMGFDLKGGASLMEDYTYDLTPNNETILGAHMLEICPTLTLDKPKLEIHPLSIGDRSDPVRLVFNASPKKDAMVIALSDMRDRFRLTANMVDVVKPKHDLPKLPVARALWKPQPSLEISAKCWLSSGAAHHTVMDTMNDREVWEDFARIAGVEFNVIDKNTVFNTFEQNLRNNIVYYKIK